MKMKQWLCRRKESALCCTALLRLISCAGVAAVESTLMFHQCASYTHTHSSNMLLCQTHCSVRFAALTSDVDRNALPQRTSQESVIKDFKGRLHSKLFRDTFFLILRTQTIYICLCFFSWSLQCQTKAELSLCPDSSGQVYVCLNFSRSFCPLSD